MRNLIVAILIVGFALPASAQTPAQRHYARQVKKQRAKAVVRVRAAEKKAEAAAKSCPISRALNPSIEVVLKAALE